MQLKSLITVLLKLNILLGRINGENKIVPSYFNLKTFSYVGLYISAAAIFFCRYSLPTIMDPDKNWTLDSMIMFFLDNTVLTLPLYQLVQSQMVMKHFKGQILKDMVFEYPMYSQILYTTIYVAMYGTGLVVQLVNNLPHDDTVLWIAAVILIFLTALALAGILILPFSCLVNIQSFLKLQLAREKFSRKDILDTAEVILRGSSAIRYTLSGSFFAVQILSIICIYATLVRPENFYCILFVLALIEAILTLVGEIETCYDLVGEVADNAREEACDEVSVREMMKLLTAVKKLEGTCPFTAFKFFSFERSTVTAMLATTLTYLVVLIQTFL